MQRLRVLRIEREDAAVPVALPRQRGEPHQLDEELVALERIRPLRELVSRLAELALADVVEEVRMRGLEMRDERAHVAVGAFDAVLVRAGAARQRERAEQRKRSHRSARSCTGSRPAKKWAAVMSIGMSGATASRRSFAAANC